MNYSAFGCQIHQSSEVNSMVSIDVFFFLANFCHLATQKNSLAPLSGVFPLFIYLFIYLFENPVQLIPRTFVKKMYQS
jgi:hypothetical protein